MFFANFSPSRVYRLRYYQIGNKPPLGRALFSLFPRIINKSTYCLLESDGNFWVVPQNLSFAPVHTEDGLGIQYYGELIAFLHRPDTGDDKETKYSFLAPKPLKGKMDILS